MKHKERDPSAGQRETRVSASPQRFEIRKNADGSRTISGTAVVFNALSEDLGFRERIAPAAFTESLKENPNVLVLAQHDIAQPLGSVESGTAKVWQDNVGVQFTCKMPDTSWAHDLASLIEVGIVRSMSFGFSVLPGGEEWSTLPDGTALRTITAALLHECSVVTSPAYTQTSVSIRNAPKHIRAQIKAKRDADRKTKTVDGEVLSAEDFIIVVDPSDPETWHLPWHFSTEKKTKSHLRDALARFGELTGLSEEVLKTAWKKLLKLCKQHGIDVSEEDTERSAKRGYFTSISLDDDDDEDDEDCDPEIDADCDEDRCECRCAECRNGGCRDCSNAYCEDDQCSASGCPTAERSLLMDMIARRLR